MKKLQIVLIATSIILLNSCFKEVVPEPKSKELHITGIQVLGGYLPTGNTFTNPADMPYDDFFISVVPLGNIRLVERGSNLFSILGCWADELNDFNIRSTSELKGINVINVQQAYGSIATGQSMNDIISVQYKGETSSLNDFNSNRTGALDQSQIRLILEVPPDKRQQHSFRVDMLIGELILQGNSPAVWLE